MKHKLSTCISLLLLACQISTREYKTDCLRLLVTFYVSKLLVLSHVLPRIHPSDYSYVLVAFVFSVSCLQTICNRGSLFSRSMKSHLSDNV